MTYVSKVLMVDDDACIRKVAELSLSRVGNFEVCVAASGDEALSRLQHEMPDVVLLDVMMPGMDGPTTLAKIREQISLDLPVIFMTAKVQKHEVDAYQMLGAAGIIAKPFDPMLLADEIRGIVKTWSENRT